MWQPRYELMTDAGEVADYVSAIRERRQAVAFDIETGYHGESRDKASLHPEENFIVGIALTDNLSWSRYIPLKHDTGLNVDERAVAEALYPLLVEDRDDEGRPYGVAHGGKFELRVMRPWFEQQLGVKLDYQQFRLRSDTMLESYAMAESRRHGLKDLTEEAEQAAIKRKGVSEFWRKQLELEELYPEKLTIAQKKQIRFNVLDPSDERVVRYVCDDTIYALGHHKLRYKVLQRELAESPNYGRGFIWKLEMAVLPVVCEMEDEGVWYDWNSMREWAVRCRDFADRYMDEVRAGFGELRGEPLSPAFNFGSPVQLRGLLYEDCGMPVTHWTKGGKSGIRQPGTDAKVALKRLSKDYPEVARYLDWKKLTKLHRDFLGKMEEKYCFAGDRRAHASLLQHGVPAGRFACNDPNYQQSPREYHYELSDGARFDFNFREMVGAPPGWYQLGFDLAQAELRGIAGLAGEQKMIDAFLHGVDVHSVTASLIFGVPIDQVTRHKGGQRDVGKTMGLALVYGLTEEGLAERLGITRDEAVELFAAFHAAYPAIKRWTEETVRKSMDGYCVYTKWGRRVPIWDYEDADTAEMQGNRKYARVRRQNGNRTAGNAPVQGSATGDYMKVAMVLSERALRKAGLKDRVRLAMNIHDALEWYVREDTDFNEVIRVLEPAIIFPVEGWPPLIAEWHMGQRWGSVRDLEKGPDGLYRYKDESEAEEEIDFSEEDEDDVSPVISLPALEELHGRPGADAGHHPVAVAERVEQDRPGAEGVLPADRPARPAGGGSDHHGPAARTVIIEAHGPVTREQVPHLVRFLEQRPGTNTVILRLPTGDVTSTRTSSLCPADQAELSVLLGGVTVRYDEASADLDSMAAGLDL